MWNNGIHRTKVNPSHRIAAQEHSPGDVNWRALSSGAGEDAKLARSSEARRLCTYIELNTNCMYQSPDPQAHPERQSDSRGKVGPVARGRRVNDDEYISKEYTIIYGALRIGCLDYSHVVNCRNQVIASPYLNDRHQ
jgi:hypothetical protein